MLKKNLVSVVMLFAFLIAFSQSETDSTLNKIASQIFLPSFDIGFQFPNSSLIGNSMVVKTSVEYRFKNNDDFFLRLGLDTYGATYNLSEINNTTNNIEGTVQFNDFLVSPGYRFGGEGFRVLISPMFGIKTYEFPSGDFDGNTIVIRQQSRSIFTSTLLIAGELYFDQKSAITLNLHYNQVCRNIDF